MPDLEENQSTFLSAPDEVMAHFLQNLAERDEGQIVILNLEAGLRLGYIIEDVLRELVRECVRQLPAAHKYDPASALAAFVQATKVEQFRFLRQPLPDVGIPAALALSTGVLLSPEAGFVDEDGLKRLEDAGMLRSLFTKQDQEILLAKLRSGELLKKGALGAAGIAVWVTRVDEEWEELTRSCAQVGVADRVRNRLGLSHSSPSTYLDVRTKRRLRDCCGGSGRRFAAPTAIEAGTHRRFRQEPDGPVGDHWNRSIDLELAFVQQGTSADGAPELVLDRLLFDDVEWHGCLGTTQTAPPGDDQSFIALLLNGRRFEEVLDSLIARLSGGR